MDRNLDKLLEMLFEKAQEEYENQGIGQTYAFRLDEMYTALAEMLPPVDYSAVEDEYIPLVREAVDNGMRWAHRRGVTDYMRLLKEFYILG